MKFFFSILCLFLLCFCNYNSSEKLQPIAINGTIDLRNWNFEKDGMVSLKGNWEFYWKEFLEESYFQTNTDKKKDLIKLPKAWNEFKIGQSAIGNEGYATYHLNMFIKNGERLALRLGRVNSSFSLYVNGKLLEQQGKIGKNLETSIPYYKPTMIMLPDSIGENVSIIIHVANFHNIYGGLRNPILLGTVKQIQSKRDWGLFIDVFLTGCFIIMGLYHFSLYLFRPVHKNRPALYFGIFCLLLAVRALLTGEDYFYQLIPSMNWVMGRKLELLTFYVGTPVFILFVFSIFPEEENQILSKLVLYPSFLLSIFVIVSPSTMFMESLTYMHVVLFIACVYGLYSLAKAILKKRKGARSFFTGSLLFSIFIFHDILLSYNVFDSVLLASFGLFIFIIFQAYSLSSLFSAAYVNVERFSKNLKIKSAKISVSNRRLVKILASSRKMSELRTRSEILCEASNVILTEIGFLNKIKIKAYYFDIQKRNEVYVSCKLEPKDMENSPPRLEPNESKERFIPFEKLEKLIGQITMQEAYSQNKTLYIPAFYHKRLLGLIKIKELEKEEVSRDQKGFINAIMRSLSLGLANVEYLQHEKKKVRMELELKTASTVQNTLFPKNSPDIPGFDIYGWCWPASETGGDWFGYSKELDEYLYIFIGDVTGHGTPAAMITSAIYSAIRQIENFYFKDGKLLDPSFIHNILHQVVCETGNQDYYMTFFTARIDLKTHILVYTNSAHNRPIIIRRDEILHLDGETNPLLGYVDEYTIISEQTKIEKGDLLLFYTDGITEAYNKNDIMYGESRLIERLKALSNKTSREIVKGLKSDLLQFCDISLPKDDYTLIACKILND
ncbi:MAG: SpoIIE family protein phosphatase [Leptospiraceae bacterium]|nr:SpoIIE family protein phosphatase [Leptospiraceae bacterium]MCP5495648.1 SpoIIE family protein phosphatase [Leptospiraceae bacterium]